MADQKYLPLEGISVDVSEALAKPTQARFIKNLVYSLDDAAIASDSKGAQSGVFKPLQSTVLYANGLSLPGNPEDNQTIGYLSSKETKELFVFVCNVNNIDTVYKLNGYDGTYNIVYQGDLGFVNTPEFYIHQGGATLKIVYITDPLTGAKIKRSFLIFTDGNDFQKQICVEDSIATNGFDKLQFPYFNGDYDPLTIVRMGISTPNNCIQVTEVPRIAGDENLTNGLLFHPWSFRIKFIDVWGIPSEHGMISDLYIPGINDCIGASTSLPRCLNLKFPAPNPFIDKIQVEFMRCGDTQWEISDTLFLYTGSSLGKWWLRQRNPDVNYNPGDGTISYQFCANRGCQAVPTSETDRLYNPLPRSSQAVTQIQETVALINNKDGFLPFTDAQKKAFRFTVIPPKVTSQNTATITIYVAIYNEANRNFQSVTKDGTNGYVWGDNGHNHGGARNYAQYFANPNQSGFGGYLVGEEGVVISTQWYVDSNGVLQEDNNHIGNDISPNRLTFQKFVFTNVPRGNYIFRLYSTLTDAATTQNYQSTSTTVYGLVPFNGNNFQISNPMTTRVPIQELQINVCNGDYNTLNQSQILLIADLAAHRTDNIPIQFRPITVYNSLTFSYKATSGYIYETQINGVNQFPVELMRLSLASGVTGLITDHNGFYYFSTSQDGRTFNFDFMYKCGIQRFGFQNDGTNMRFLNLYLDKVKLPLYPDYPVVPCNRVLIKGRILLSGKNIGVPNITVVLSRGQSAVTDASGNFTIAAHDDIAHAPRVDKLFIAGGGCNYSVDGGGCLPVIPVTMQRCTTCGVREINIADVIVVYKSDRGLLSGGTYQLGATGYEWMGRASFIQPIGQITIPSITESQTIGASQVQVDIDPAVVFPSDFEYLTLSITKETTIDAYVDWIVDNVEFIDNTGNLNTTAPTQIRIYYSSLLEYNKQNNFNTTVNWQFLEPLPPNSTSATRTPFQTDTVQFFLNGDGKFFPTNITALVKYDQDGQYFLIDYTDALKGLLPNALIRLSRPRVCTGNEAYYEICGKIDLINGRASIESFILNAFDTYYLNRSIPVPVPVNPSNAATVSETVTTTHNADGSVTNVTQTVNETVNTVNQQRQFGFFFEHDSPSNFWGKGCFNGGRTNAKNPYETIIYSIQQFALSGATSPNGQLNFFDYFDNAKKTNLGDTNGITSALPEQGIILVIGVSDNFVVGFNDTIARVNAQGQVIAPSIKNEFGEPGNKIGSNYGCQLFDKSSISKREGRVLFVDSTRACIVAHNYQNAIPISYQDVNGYVTPKIKDVQSYNIKNGPKRYFVSVINPINNEYIISDHIIGSADFSNDLREEDVTVQETFGVGVFTKMWKGWYSFTPEYFGFMDGDINDQQLISFINGIPYRHSTTLNPTYGNIYGKPVERVVDFIAVVDNLRKKKPTAIQQYSIGSQYFVDKITTETNQVSRILLSAWLQAEYGWYAPFLCDVAYVDPNKSQQDIDNIILEGNMLVGTWVRIRLVGDPASNEKYSELQGMIVNLQGSEPSGLKK